MIDQATRLRGLMESRFTELTRRAANGAGLLEPGTGSPTPPLPAACVVAVTSGKGGVGKSSIALNVSIALQRAGKRVCLADANFGLANIDLLCGLNGYWNLTHVVSGARSLADVLLQGPEGVRVASGASAVAELADRPFEVQRDVVGELSELETEHDFLVIDTGTGIHQHTRPFVAAADLAVIVTTPEPTAIADAYATVKTFSTNPPRTVLAVVNQASSSEQAEAILERLQQTARLFLHTEVVPGGWIPADPQVASAVVHRTPLLLHSPRSSAAQAVERLAQRIRSTADSQTAAGGYFTRLLERRRRPAA